MATDPWYSIKTGLNLRSALRRVLPAIDVLTAIPTLAAGAYFFVMKRLGLNEMALNKRLLERVGIWPIRRHYYEPYFDSRMIRRPLDEPRDLPGLDLRTAQSLALIAELSAFAGESITTPGPDGSAYSADNGTYGLADASLLYAMIRHLGPSRMIEVGSGNSTLVAKAALARNAAEGKACEHVCIEPYEMPWLEATGATIVRQMVEDVPPALFDSLGGNDILFIDNSHMVRPQGDVLTIMQSILPRLRPGVVVHIHDLFTPRDYPPEWLLRDRTLWNEQYLVEAFLTFNDAFEIVAAANHLFVDHREAFDRLRPELASQQWKPSAMWLRRRG